MQDNPITSNGTNDQGVHLPELPGVRTFSKDKEREPDDAEVDGVRLTVPEKVATSDGDENVTAAGNKPGGKALFDVGRAFNDEAVQEGTFVTDQKRKRVTTGAVLKSAFSEWWGHTQKKVQGSLVKLEALAPKEEVKVVANAETRANIIQAAAQHAKQAPRDDHAIVVEKVRTFAHDAEVATGKPFILKDSKPKAPGEWGGAPQKTDTQTASVPKEAPAHAKVPTLDLRDTMIAPTMSTRSSTPLATYAQSEKSSVTQNNNGHAKTLDLRSQPAQRVVAPLVKQNEKIPTRKKEEAWSFFKDAPKGQVDLRTVVEQTAPKTVRLERPTVPVPVPVPPPLKVAIPPPPILREEIKRPEPPRVFEEEKEDTYTEEERLPNTREEVSDEMVTRDPFFLRIPRPILLGGIVLIGAIFGITSAFMSFRSSSSPEEIAQEDTKIKTPAFIDVDTTTSVPLGDTKTVLLGSLTTELTRQKNGVEYLSVTIKDAPETLATTEQVMDILEPRAESSFVRALHPEHMFGSVGGSTRAPFLIIRSTNFDVAFAGMLSWEQTMSEDLSPFFGNPVTKTLVLKAGSDPTTAHFVDALKTNQSIRILYDEKGEERIVYAFVNKELIVITSSTEALSTLIEHIK